MTSPTPRAGPVLAVDDLAVEFRTDDGVVRAVDGVSFALQRGEVLGIVGESGCGKSVTNLAVLGLLPKPAGRIARGSVRFDGRELVGLPERELRTMRGNRIAMIFQDPMTSLNPYLTVEEQLAEVGVLHLGLTRPQAVERAVDLLTRVGISDAGRRIRSYPHEFSGGMRQRVMIAMALLCDPAVLIADEPTTALDVTIQAQILDLLADLRRERGMAVVLVTHDLGVVAGVADRILVMYAGRVVEEAPTRDLFARPTHPYTLGLLRSVPRVAGAAHSRLAHIEGIPPRLDKPFDACPFAPRCAFVRDACRRGVPPLVVADGRARRCVVPAEEVR
ncbi:MAG: ABC transporter ATP-binding protein [Planctomycetia bacterium]|nr:ABC transporter ATP-binding protein [Planctomycetia bacterium]